MSTVEKLVFMASIQKVLCYGLYFQESNHFPCPKSYWCFISVNLDVLFVTPEPKQVSMLPKANPAVLLVTGIAHRVLLRADNLQYQLLLCA